LITTVYLFISDEIEKMYIMQLTVTELGTRDGNDILVCLEQFLSSLFFFFLLLFYSKVIKTLVYHLK